MADIDLTQAQERATKRNCYVYTLRDPRCGEKIIYVGMGRGTRRHMHTRRPKRLAAFVAEHGKTPARIVADNLTETEAYALEVELIAQYGRECDGGQLLNVSLGGPGAPGRVADTKSRERMAAAHRGQRHSPESIAKAIATRRANAKPSPFRGRPLPPEAIARAAAVNR